MSPSSTSPVSSPVASAVPAEVTLVDQRPTDEPPTDAPVVTFAELGVPPVICDALGRRGITAPFAIQATTVPDALAGRDILGRAPTGSGKTLAFGIPLVARVVADQSRNAKPDRRPSALVLVPTRELAEQITDELRSFSGRVRIDAVYGGVGYGHQLTALRRGVDVLVACPGRLEDLIERRDVDLSAVRLVVLDEADRMADMGFVPAVRRILALTRDDRQTLLFSATLDGEVGKLARDHQHDPVRHEVGEDTPDVKSATHLFWSVERERRNAVVADVVNAAWPSIVFTRTRHGADRLAGQLERLGLRTAPLHGGRSQAQRNRALDDFARRRVHVLVATDVAARGIHVDGVASVIHYDPPEDHTTYVHRSGRTARAGAEGVVVSLVQRQDQRHFDAMQRKLGIEGRTTPPALTELPGAGIERPDLVLAEPLAPIPDRTATDGRPGGPKQHGNTKQGRPGGSKPYRSAKNGRSTGAPRDAGAGRDGGQDRGRDTANGSGRPGAAKPNGTAKSGRHGGSGWAGPPSRPKPSGRRSGGAGRPSGSGSRRSNSR